MSKDQVIEEGTNKVNDLLSQKKKIADTLSLTEAYSHEDHPHKGVKSCTSTRSVEDIKIKQENHSITSIEGKDEKYNQIDSQIDAELNKMSEAAKADQGNTAQAATEQATTEAKAQEQNNDDSADKAEIANQQSRNKDLQSKTAEVNQQKATEEQNLASAKENTKNVVSGLNPEQKEFVIQKLTEQGDTEAVNFINSQPTPQQEAQDPNVMGQTQEHNDHPQ